jgi:hypothetical protein
VAGSCEYGNETLGFIKRGEFLEELSDCQLLKKDCSLQYPDCGPYYESVETSKPVGSISKIMTLFRLEAGRGAYFINCYQGTMPILIRRIHLKNSLSPKWFAKHPYKIRATWRGSYQPGGQKKVSFHSTETTAPC